MALDYQQAKSIRGTKVADLLATAVMDSPSIREAVKKTVSLKLEARTKGFKEKFDPLNIAKFMTFGSKMGPALLGKLTGRSKRDIEYFTGRLKPIRPALLDNADLSLGDTSSKQPKGSSMTAILRKMLTYQNKMWENERKRQEINRNFEEERELEAQKRHKSLIEAIEKLTNKNDKSLNIELLQDNTEEKSIFGDIFGNLAEAKVIWDMLKKSGPWLSTVLGGPMALATWIAAAFLIPYALSAKQKEEIKKDPFNSNYDNNAYALSLRAQINGESGRNTTEGGQAENLRASSLKQYRRNVIEEYVGSNQTDDELKREFGTNREGLKKWLQDNPKRDAMFQVAMAGNQTVSSQNIRQENGKLELPAGIEPSKAGAGRGVYNLPSTQQLEDKEREEMAKPFIGFKTGIRSTPQVTTDTTKKLIQSTQENVDANLPAPKPEVPSVVNNVSQSSGGPDIGNNFYVPSVRDHQETLRRMVYNSTYVV